MSVDLGLLQEKMLASGLPIAGLAMVESHQPGLDTQRPDHWTDDDDLFSYVEDRGVLFRIHWETRPSQEQIATAQSLLLS